MPRLPPRPDLEWSADGAPRARGFDDIYFSREGGLAETDAVFLAGCDLPAAWRDKDRFAICELGFGTGLNVLAVWRAWKKTRLPHAQLHISSIEAFPLDRADATRALSAFPEVADLAEALLAQWPVRAAAPQRLCFPDDGLSLTLHHGDAETILDAMVGRFDAWFLDGFAPARNPAMWSPALMRRIVALSAPGARLATFTVAGAVRRGLEEAGFQVAKQPGFGRKRDRLEARLPESPLAETLAPYPYAPTYPKRVAIIGAGIAGAACAAALARRGADVVVLEAARDLGAGASGNPAGLIMPRLDRGGPLAELFLAAYLDAVKTYEALDVFTRCGVEERADEKRAEALADLLADPPLPPDWFAALPGGAALHLRAGLVDPRAAVAAMLADAQVLYETPIETLERAEGGWILRTPDQRAVLRADAVVLACGPALARFAPASFMPLELSHGQIEWGEGAAPPYALTRGSYVAPFEGGALFGATFDKQPTSPAEARTRNLDALAKLAPDVAASIEAETLRSRASVRAATPDRAPIAGLLPDAEAWLAAYADLAHGRPIKDNAPPPAHDGVYVVGGLGARGLTLAPLLGERIAAEMFNEPQALSAFALKAISPARFLHRALKRR
jgi:tRNA 5-methylaminomethyl-2-thiouridine biosynthesis bifunctional protein